MKYRHRRDKGVVEVEQGQDNSWKVFDARGLVRMTDADFHKYYEPVTPFDPPETKEPTISDFMDMLGDVIKEATACVTEQNEEHKAQYAKDLAEAIAWRMEMRKRIMDLAQMLQLHCELDLKRDNIQSLKDAKLAEEKSGPC